ncbi:Mitotic spindle checkpoint protein bubr1 [Thalictrum thalictroides]|uniref:Mitotic spindle checkpoint protein bubr1 n=1 Tax=Thalictrum thalictroides TaxID=46969 RepID=A0A7J6WLM9_THATH|nr:Mitotic spindle checkpoint protein bubr1 [Thalictrum thalictroides]
MESDGGGVELQLDVGAPISSMPLPLASSVDPETEFLLSNKTTGNEWELFKENVRPIKRGRNINLLNHSLKSHSHNHLQKSLLLNRRRLIEAIDEYQGDDPLQPWLDCIKWVQESFPSGGDFSGLVVIYEQCLRAFWHTERYKDDLRYLKVWLEYAESCTDAEVIYSFLDANGIGKTHSVYYITYALHMESKNKMKNANDIFNLGLAREAQPMKKLEAAYKKFLSRSLRKSKQSNENIKDPTDDLPVRSFGTILGRQASDVSRKRMKSDRVQSAPLSIYKDAKPNTIPNQQSELPKATMTSWQNLGTRAERNKENCAIPTKWTSNKIPQKLGSRSAVAAASSCIEVFVDEDCQEKIASESQKSSMLQLRRGDNRDLKKETELLKENPLRNFPTNSLPR